MEAKQHTERVDHPAHYAWMIDAIGVEPIDICRLFDFSTGNALKYIFRSGRKTEDGMTAKAKEIEDLRKAVYYLQDRIARIEAECEKFNKGGVIF